MQGMCGIDRSINTAWKCIRMMPEDQTNGFFVAVFQRKVQASTSGRKILGRIRVSKGNGRCFKKRRGHLCVFNRHHPFKRPLVSKKVHK